MDRKIFRLLVAISLVLNLSACMPSPNNPTTNKKPTVSEKAPMTLKDLYPIEVKREEIIPLELLEIEGNKLIGFKESEAGKLKDFIKRNDNIVIPYGISEIEDYGGEPPFRVSKTFNSIVFPNSLEALGKSPFPNLKVDNIVFPNKTLFFQEDPYFDEVDISDVMSGKFVYHDNRMFVNDIFSYAKVIDLSNFRVANPNNFNSFNMEELILPANFDLAFVSLGAVGNYPYTRANNLYDKNYFNARPSIFNTDKLNKISFKDEEGKICSITEEDPLFKEFASFLNSIDNHDLYQSAKKQNKYDELRTKLRTYIEESGLTIGKSFSIEIDGKIVSNLLVWWPKVNPFEHASYKTMVTNRTLEAKYFDYNKFYTKYPDLSPMTATELELNDLTIDSFGGNLVIKIDGTYHNLFNTFNLSLEDFNKLEFKYGGKLNEDSGIQKLVDKDYYFSVDDNNYHDFFAVLDSDKAYIFFGNDKDENADIRELFNKYTLCLGNGNNNRLVELNGVKYEAIFQPKFAYPIKFNEEYFVGNVKSSNDAFLNNKKAYMLAEDDLVLVSDRMIFKLVKLTKEKNDYDIIYYYPSDNKDQILEYNGEIYYNFMSSVENETILKDSKRIEGSDTKLYEYQDGLLLIDDSSRYPYHFYFKSPFKEDGKYIMGNAKDPLIFDDNNYVKLFESKYLKDSYKYLRSEDNYDYYQDKDNLIRWDNDKKLVEYFIKIYSKPKIQETLG